MDQPTVVSIARYPVKGLSPEPLATATIGAGETLPLDRAYAIENGPGPFDPAAPRHLPKVTFLCLMRNARLASLQTRLVQEGGRHDLTLSRQGQRLAAGDLLTADGRAAIEAFFAAEMGDELRGAPRIVAADGHSFSDVKEKCLHLVNLATVRALQQAMGRAIDPLRFRANLLIDGLPAWAELNALGRDIKVGADGVRLHIFKRTVRCAATDVDPSTGVRDGAVPDAISALAGHRDFGVYAIVTGGGVIRAGDLVTGF